MPKPMVRMQKLFIGKCKNNSDTSDMGYTNLHNIKNKRKPCSI